MLIFASSSAFLRIERRGAKSARRLIERRVEFVGYAMSGESPQTEAAGLFKLLRHGAFSSADEVRTLIGNAPERREILLRFDALCIRRGHPAVITDTLRNEILRLLKLNWSQEKVAKELHVSLVIVRRCAIPAQASTWKRGKGRRFTAEKIEEIKAAIRAGGTSRSVERKFHIDWHTVHKLRRQMNDYEDRRRRKKLSADQLEQAREQIAAGARWVDVAREFGVAPTTLLSNITYRKHAAYQHFTSQEKRTILGLVRRGVGKRTIAARFGRPRSSIYLFLSRTAHG